MNKISIEIYKAFAQTKPSEFDSFHRDWITEHASAIEDVVEIPLKPKRTRKPKPKVIENSVVFESETEPETPEEEPTEE